MVKPSVGDVRLVLNGDGRKHGPALRSHLQQLDGMLNEVKPVGRKLDFLVQEMNRETNTIGSKANDVSMAQIVVNIKSEIEKIREQIQNIE